MKQNPEEGRRSCIKKTKVERKQGRGGHTDGAANSNHLQMPPLEPPRKPRVRRLQVSLMDIIVALAVVLGAASFSTHGRLVLGIEGRDAAARVPSEAVKEARGDASTLVVIDGLPHRMATAVGERVLSRLDGGHLEGAVGDHGRLRGVRIRGAGVWVTFY